MVDSIGNREPGVQKSLMHRFNEVSVRDGVRMRGGAVCETVIFGVLVVGLPVAVLRE